MFSTIFMPIAPQEAPFFFDSPVPNKFFCKVYNDGSHYVATKYTKASVKPLESAKRENKDIDILFNSLYFNAVKSGLKGYDLTECIKQGILKLFSHLDNIDDFIEKKIERSINNTYKRKKRFRRKANLNQWNYFVTITYNDKKHDAETFRKKLRKCLSNLHTRRGYKYMGVFEYAPETNRLHFHAIMYIPGGEMLGFLERIEDYDIHKGAMQTRYSNNFFEDNFGRNDFREIDNMALKNGNSINYLLKYIGKTNERIVYSRGVPTEIFMKISENDIAIEMLDFVSKYVLFDDVVDWERDILHAKYTQMSIIDLTRKSS